MGPCRITPKAPRGICGCDVHGIVGRNTSNLLQAAQLLIPITDVEICNTLWTCSTGWSYQVKDPAKLIRIAKEWGVETEGRDIYDLAHEMSELALSEYGKTTAFPDG